MLRFADTDQFRPRETACDPPPDDPVEFPLDDPSGYDLLAEIGRGGMGVVFRAVDQAMGREVAVKILSPRYAADSSAAVRFVAEARITSRLQHPGVPAVYQVGRTAAGRPFYAMRLIEGDTLESLLASSEPLDRLAVFEAVAQTVGYAHSRGVVHRDLKPGNVMIGAFGEVQVMDWGLAKILPPDPPPAPPEDPAATPVFEAPAEEGGDLSDPENNSIFGTPAYMAPEQAGGEAKKVGRCSDVFGLGAILCSLLTGRPPFDGANLESVHLAALHAETEDAFQRLAACGAESDVIDLCKRCLSQSRAARPRDGSAVAREVTRIRAAAADRARQAERALMLAEQAAAERRRRRAARRGFAVLAVGLAGTALGLVWEERIRAEADRARVAAEARASAAEAELFAARARLAATERGFK